MSDEHTYENSVKEDAPKVVTLCEHGMLRGHWPWDVPGTVYVAAGGANRESVWCEGPVSSSQETQDG